VKAAREVLRVIPHGGGMMTGARRQNVTPQLREYVKPHDARIAQLSGQPFGLAYLDGLLHDTSAVFDSAPPTAAMLAAEELIGRGLDMLAQLQIAHYVEGRQISDRSVLIDVAASLGLDAADFAIALDRQSGEALQAHIQQTRSFMTQVGAQGFPSLVLESEGVFQSVDFSKFLGRPQAFQAWLRSQSGVVSIAPAAPAGEVCDDNGCAL
jgi:putative protein-disulfide isomerase